jgi:hypothetical protein
MVTVAVEKMNFFAVGFCGEHAILGEMVRGAFPFEDVAQ